MNIQPVELREGQTLQCSVCFRMCAPIWADLDGPAFKAYYCAGHRPDVQPGEWIGPIK
jgi:hypothetical protein